MAPAGGWRVEIHLYPKTRDWLRPVNEDRDEVVKDLVLPAPPIETPQHHQPPQPWLFRPIDVPAPHHTVRRFP
jgi:hypothetical protein